VVTGDVRVGDDDVVIRGATDADDILVELESLTGLRARADRDVNHGGESGVRLEPC
jgi:hypothetical protein